MLYDSGGGRSEGDEQGLGIKSLTHRILLSAPMIGSEASCLIIQIKCIRSTHLPKVFGGRFIDLRGATRCLTCCGATDSRATFISRNLPPPYLTLYVWAACSPLALLPSDLEQPVKFNHIRLIACVRTRILNKAVTCCIPKRD